MIICNQLKLSVKEFTDKYFKASVTWDDISWIKRQTTLPIILKGVMHYQDMILAQENLINTVILSNHGGRQLDYAISSIEVLEIIKEKLSITILIIIDSRIRSGLDIAKAIAMSADA